MCRLIALLATVVVALTTTTTTLADAFRPTFVTCSRCNSFATNTRQQQTPRQYATALRMAVQDINSEASFDKIVKSAGSSLVVVDYSTTWCGPCKVIAPKFEQFSEKYPGAVFLKVIGDATPDASKLMKREGVRSVPSFHYFMNGEKIDVVNGANADAIEGAITKHLHANA